MPTDIVTPMAALIPFLLLITIGWIGILTFVSKISGWSRLEKELRPHSMPPALGGTQQQAYWTSGRINWANYNNCLNISTSRFGLRLSVVKIFSFGHSPLFIPWEQVQKLELKTVLFNQTAHLVLKDSKRTKLQLSAKIFVGNTQVPAFLLSAVKETQNPYQS